MKRIGAIVFWLAAALQAVAMAAPAPSSNTPAAARHGAAAAKLDPRDLLFACPTRLDHIGRIVAPVEIDGRGPFRFVVDTGANHSTISPHLARALGLVPARGDFMLVTGITGQQQLPWVPIALLQAGQLKLRNVRMPVVESPIMAGTDGILGVAGLTGDRITVDFQHNEVWISRSSGGAVWDFIDIPAHRAEGGLLIIPAHIGSIAVEAVIDTGSPRTLGNLALREALLLHPKDAQAARIYGVTKEVSVGQMAVSPTIALGPARIRHLSIVYSDIPIFKVWHLDHKPAVIIGMDVLGTVDDLVLDFARARVYMLPVAPPGVEVIRKMSMVLRPRSPLA